MELFVFGLNHTTAPVDIRERWAYSVGQSQRVLRSMSRKTAASEHLILSTCNRTEFYSRLPRRQCPMALEDDSGAQRRALARFYRTPLPGGEIDPEHFYLHRQERAVEHLFRLAGGLDSMIIGESEILRQIKDAFGVAQKAQSAGAMFHRLFPEALKVGKNVRTATGISRGCITPGQAGLRLARETLGDIARQSVLVIGSGKIASLTARALCDEGVERFLVVNRTREKAREMLRQIRRGSPGAGASDPVIDWSRLREALVESSVVISSTSSGEPLVGAAVMAEVQQERGHAPLVIVDLAIPRDFHPDVARVDGVHLFNIDDLNNVIQENIAQRHKEREKAEIIVRRHVSAFFGRLAYLEVDPVIRHIVERFEEIRLGELQSAIDRFPAASHGALDELTRALVKKLLNFPIERLKTLREIGGLNPTEVAFLKRLFPTNPPPFHDENHPPG